MQAQNSSLDIKCFETCAGDQIYQIPLKEFPGLWGYVYVVLAADVDGTPMRVLVDTGSGYGESNQHLDLGLEAVSKLAGDDLSLANLTHILITHGHIDHFGGLSYVRPRTSALVGVHELDLRNLTNYEERLAIVARRLSEFLLESGVSLQRKGELIDLYKITKSIYHSVRVDFTYEAAGMRLGRFEMLHVPGHCAGHVVIRLEDVLFSGDHILEQISPHQSPEHLTLSTGLEHYLNSLKYLRPWAEGVRLTLGGHKEPITDLSGRLDAIQRIHEQRLEQVLELLVEPHTILEVSKELFGEVQGYTVLLALEEAGAHVEYLYQRGKLAIENLEEVENGDGLAPIRYRCLPCFSD
jgi:glyoxylase-like metal-dependent hydrolase (beta-lactamase superfamily II)